jgi:hypothetical protein
LPEKTGLLFDPGASSGAGAQVSLADLWSRGLWPDRDSFTRGGVAGANRRKRESHDPVQDAGAVVVFGAFGDIAEPLVERDHGDLRLDRGRGEADLLRVVRMWTIRSRPSPVPR